jgi:hypothetical protein
MALAFAGPFASATSVLLGVASVMSIQVAAMLPLRQTKRRPAELACGAGFVEVRSAGTRNQRIVAKDIVGATTARDGDKVLLTLAHLKRDQPITFEVESEAQAEELRRALGIGHSGFGMVGWKSHATGNARSALIGRLLSTLLGLFVVAVALGGSPEAALGVGLVASNIIFVGLVLSLVGFFSKASEPSIVMTADGLRLFTPRGWFNLPYASVSDVEDRKRALVFKVPAPFFEVGVETSGPLFGGMSPEDRRGLMAQVRSAAYRARGYGPQKDDVTGRIDQLRRSGESPRDWLARLDMAGRMLGAGPGYRGHSLDTEDLWAVLEDPDADGELRAAAARVLRHAPLPNARQRIDAALATVRDEATVKRLRIAIDDDLEGATQELAVLDAETRGRHQAHFG